MILLTLAVLAFAAVHLMAAIPPAKQALQARLGKAYGPAFGTASLLSLVLIAFAWSLRDILPVYEPPVWGRHVTFLLVLFAFVCLGIWMFRGNLRQWLRFPFAVAAMFWGAGHLLARGDAASLVLFGGLALYGLAHFVIASANGLRPSAEVRGGHDLLSILFGIAFYGIAAQLHGVIIGVPVLVLTK